MYEPISIEQMTSDNWNTFMEKALPVNAFIPGRNFGFTVQNTAFDKRLTWAAGYYFQQQVAYGANGVAQDTTADLFAPHDNATQIAARVTGLPWYENNGEHLLHIGFGYTHLFRSNNGQPDSSTGPYNNPAAIDFKSSPEANLFSPLVDTGYFFASGVDIVDPEIAMVYGPFSLQAEYIWVSATGITNASFTSSGTITQGPIGNGSNANFDGWYAQASYFLTGEHRAYAKDASPATYMATFGRVIPNCNFNPVSGGWGAWELAARVSQLDVNDAKAGFNGGLETDYTLGINWYLNPNVMVKMDYVHATVDSHLAPAGTNNSYGTLGANGSDNIFETRFQIAF
jgi:phosphate-selective porin OprO/OprP